MPPAEPEEEGLFGDCCTTHSHLETVGGLLSEDRHDGAEVLRAAGGGDRLVRQTDKLLRGNCTAQAISYCSIPGHICWDVAPRWAISTSSGFSASHHPPRGRWGAWWGWGRGSPGWKPRRIYSAPTVSWENQLVEDRGLCRTALKPDHQINL